MTIQKVINNGFGAYKSSETAVKPGWGVERVIFKNLVEESSVTGFSAFRLGNRDSRFLFKNGVSVWITGTGQFGGVNNVTTNNATSVFLNSAPQSVALNTVLGSLEIDFYGTDINLLIGDGLIGGNDNMVIRPFTTPTGSTTETVHSTINLPTGSTDGTGPNRTISDRSTKSNQVLPLNLGLTEGSYTLRLEFIINDASSTNSPNGQLPLFGCEIVNVRTSLSGNTTISDGQMFDDGYRYDLSSETGLPLIPSAYGSNTNGARVINYINSLDKAYEQAIEIVPSSSIVAYRAEISAGATWSIPTSVTSFTVVAHGAGGNGGAAKARNSTNGRLSLGAGSGGGGGAFLSTTYTKTAASGGTLSFTLGGGGSGTSTVITGGGTGLSGSVTLPAGISGIQVDRDAGPANTENFVTGSGGNAGTAPANATITGLTASNTTLTSGIVGGDASYQTSTGDFGGTARGTTAGAGGDSGPSSGGAAGNGGVLTTGTSQSAPTSGEVPGAGGGGQSIFYNGSGDAFSSFFTGGIQPTAGAGQNVPGAVGATGRVTIEFTGASGLGNQGAGFQEVVDHSNEEVVRKVNWREFGIAGSVGGLDNGFADTTNTGLAQYAFTLDDGTTTLAGNQISIQTEQGVNYPSVGANSSASNRSALRFTFVGTGLDVLGAVAQRAPGNFPYDVIVDGVNIGSLPNPGTGIINRVFPLISGLSYGTHVVVLQVQSGGTNFAHFGPTDFIIYGPKKPDGIPTGSVEIADYNLMADYVIKPAATGNASVNPFISQGTLGKTFSRELRYNGGWSDFTSSNVDNPKIFNTFTGTFGAYMEYTFYGTGFELMARTNSSNFSATIRIDGALYTGAATPIKGNATISTWTPSSSTWTQTGAAFREGLSISGLSLGLHTIRLTFTAGSQIHLQDISTITPIHYQNPDLKVGNTSIGDVRPDYADISPADGQSGTSGEAKAWVGWDETNDITLSSYNIAAVVKSTTGGVYTVFFDKPFKSANYVMAGTSDNGLCNVASGGRNEQHPSSINLQLRRVDSGALAEVGWDVAFYGELIDE